MQNEDDNNKCPDTQGWCVGQFQHYHILQPPAKILRRQRIMAICHQSGVYDVYLVATKTNIALVWKIPYRQYMFTIVPS